MIEDREIAFQRVRIDKVMWRLYEEQLGIDKEKSQRLFNEIFGGYMVAIKHDNEFTLGLL